MFQHDLSMTAARPSDLKVNNRIQILDLFKSGEDLSVAEIAHTVGVSRQTVMKAIIYFQQKGILVSTGKAESGSAGGKRAWLFALNPDRLFFNIVICPSFLYISLFNYRREVIDEHTDAEIVKKGVGDIFKTVIDGCEALLERHNIDRSNLKAVSITCPGVFDPSGKILRFSTLFPDWGRDIPVTEPIKAHFGSSVHVVAKNITRLCGSVYLPDSLHHRRVATVFTHWSGASSCLMSDGAVLMGKDNMIGFGGHIIINPDDTEICACGGRGCFERQVSIDRLRQVAAGWGTNFPDSALFQSGLENMTIQSLFEASSQGDKLAQKLSGYVSTCFVNYLRTLSLMFNPDRVIIQGDYAYADDYFKNVVERELPKFYYYDLQRSDPMPFQFDMDTRSVQELSTLGAYTLLIDHVFSDEAVYHQP